MISSSNIDMLQEDFYKNFQDREIQTGGFYPEKTSFILQEVGKNKKVLDIGCNTGYIGEQLIRNKNQVWGIDMVKKDLDEAKKKGLIVKLSNIEQEEIPFKEKYDVVILADVIEHVFDTDGLLEKSFKILKKGGKLIVTTPNVASLGRRLMLLFGISPYLEYSLRLPTNGLPSVGHIRYYTTATLREQLEKNGFNGVRTHGNEIFLGPLKSKKIGYYLPSFSSMLMTSCTR